MQNKRYCFPFFWESQLGTRSPTVIKGEGLGDGAMSEWQKGALAILNRLPSGSNLKSSLFLSKR